MIRVLIAFLLVGLGLCAWYGWIVGGQTGLAAVGLASVGFLFSLVSTEIVGRVLSSSAEPLADGRLSVRGMKALAMITVFLKLPVMLGFVWLAYRLLQGRWMPIVAVMAVVYSVAVWRLATRNSLDAR